MFGGVKSDLIKGSLKSDFIIDNTFRVAGMDRLALDAYGLETSKQLAEMLKRTKTSMHVRFTL